MDSYGFGKLDAEDYLIKHCEKNSKRYFAMRFPDVIGPYDIFWGSRFWQLMNRIKYSS